MTTPTTPLAYRASDRPRRPFLSVFLPSALTLAAVLSLGVWLLRDGGSDAPATIPAVEQSPAVVSEVLTGQERGGLAELQQDLARQSPAPYVVYLVESIEQQQAMTDRGLAEGEAVLLSGTPEEQVVANTQIELLEMNTRQEPVVRAVRIVDLRPAKNGAATTAAPALDQPHFTP